MSLDTKIKILHSCVIPSLTYGAQTWALTKKQRKRLQGTRYNMLRSILGVKIKDKINISKILKITKSVDIWSNLKLSKFKFAGHIARSSHLNWAKRLTEWTPYNFKRNKGRPPVR